MSKSKHTLLILSTHPGEDPAVRSCAWTTRGYEVLVNLGQGLFMHTVGWRGMIYWKSMRIYWLFAVTLLTLPCQIFGYDCTSGTYQNTSAEFVSQSFLAGDKIYVKISCLKLPPGEYSLVVNWDKYNRGTVRTDQNHFVIKSEADRDVYFWMKIGKKGLANRIFSLSDYNTDLIGKWTARLYLNNEPVKESEFMVD